MNEADFRAKFAGTPIEVFYDRCVGTRAILLSIIGCIHQCFDIWYSNDQLRFGYKELDRERASCTVGRLDIGACPPGSPLFKLYYGTNNRNGGWAPRAGIDINTADDLPKACDTLLAQRAEQAQAIGVDNLGNPAVPDGRDWHGPSDYGDGRRRGNGGGRRPGPETNSPKTQQLNIILYGPPGTGKTFATTGLALSIVADDCPGVANYANALLNGDTLTPPERGHWSTWVRTYEAMQRDGRIVFTTFHQNYAYEDFVEGIRAQVVDNQVGYTYQNGILKEIAYRALCEWLTGRPPENANQMSTVVQAWLKGGDTPALPPNTSPRDYVLIIDEINRGNIARILGELITLLEPTKRATRNPGLGDQPLKVKLPYTQESFILPPNLYIIGTMNTADRSLIGLDVALRRRFSFVELRPSPELLANVDRVNLQALLEKINERIAAELDDEHLLGHAYFMGVDTMAKLATVMRDRVIPQLREYFHDRPEALISVLACSNRTDTSPLLTLNGGRVHVMQNALDEAASYTAIYN